MFYGRLFSLDPALKPLFKGNLQAQGRKLMSMRWYGRSARGEAFTPEVEEAWVAAYGVLAKTMKDAAAVTA